MPCGSQRVKKQAVGAGLGFARQAEGVLTQGKHAVQAQQAGDLGVAAARLLLSSCTDRVQPLGRGAGCALSFTAKRLPAAFTSYTRGSVPTASARRA